MHKPEDILPCPFCGDKPDIDTDGTCIEIVCCSSMSIQKSDYLTIEQRDTWSNKTLKYSPEAEAHALDVITKQWNSRSKPSLKEAIDNITEEEILEIADSITTFEEWWHNEGSGITPTKDEDLETFMKRVAVIAWNNGGIKA